MITKEQNVLVMRDIMCSGYVAGGNTLFFGQTDYMARKKGAAADAVVPYAKTEIQQAIMDRLNFVDDASGEYEAMMAFVVPYGDGAKRDQVISISSRLLPWEVTMNAENQYRYFPGGQNAALKTFYMDRYQLDHIHHGEDIRASEAQDFISAGSINNSLCFIGPHRVHSPWSNTFYDLCPGQGHFGPDALPGDAR